MSVGTSQTNNKLQIAFVDLRSTISPFPGGIAQLVERQLCKLDVRGSNPLASILRSRRRSERRLSRRSLGVGGPVRPCERERGELRLGKPLMHYVYILQSDTDERRFYTGLTNDLRKRLRSHNAGHVAHTAKWKPWHLKTYVAFQSRTRASEFEQYFEVCIRTGIREKRL